MPSVLFVCTANICRSPMAMALFRSKVEQQPGEWRVESAGNWALEGEPAAYKSRLVLAERGLDVSEHRARSVNKELLGSFNLILTMEKGHKEAIQVEFPDVADRLYMLSEMIDQKYDIHDPIGGSIDDFRETLITLDQILTDGFDRIVHLAQDAD